jgi:hypothetical protein
MSKKLELTLAVGDYEITRALQDGSVKADGIELNVLTKMDSTTRHWRFLRNRDFDVAEVSCSSYIASKDKDFGFESIPVFLHRRFRHGFIFINTSKGITKPTDLIGKKIGLKQYQSTAILWLRGLLDHEYGVPFKSIEWFTELDESIEFTKPEGLKLQKIRDDQSIEQMLAEGEIDALIHPDLIQPLIDKDPRVGRLFPKDQVFAKVSDHISKLSAIVGRATKSQRGGSALLLVAEKILQATNARSGNLFGLWRATAEAAQEKAKFWTQKILARELRKAEAQLPLSEEDFARASAVVRDLTMKEWKKYHLMMKSLKRKKRVIIRDKR